MAIENNDTSERDAVPIPEPLQDIPLEDLVANDYDAVPPQMTDDNNDDRRPPDPGAMSDPGRWYGQDSVEASEEGRDRTDDGHDYTAGYDTNMATRIGGIDGDPDAERLQTLHEGRHQSDGKHSARETQRDKPRIAQAICSALPITDREREMVTTVMEQLDLQPFGSQRGIPRVVLGVAAVIIDEHARADQGLDREIVARHDDFRDLCTKHDVSMSDLTTLKKIVREQLADQRVGLESWPRRRDPALPGPTTIEDRPDEFWENHEPAYWEAVAKEWENHPETFRNGLPEQYQRLVENLRRWEPWTTEKR